MKKIFKSIMFCVVMTTAVFCRGDANDFRFKMNPSPKALYKSMLDASMQGKFESIPASLDSMGGITGEIKSEFGVDAKKAVLSGVESKGKETCINGIHKLMYYDIKCIFLHVLKYEKDTPKNLKMLLQAAYDNYMLFAEEAKKRNFALDMQNKKAFSNASMLLRVEANVTASDKDTIKEVDFKTLKAVLDKIEENTEEIFPEFKSVKIGSVKN